MFDAIASITSAAVTRGEFRRTGALYDGVLSPKVFLSSKLLSERAMYYRDRRGSCGRAGVERGNGLFQGVSFCQSTARKFKKNQRHISLGSAYCRTFSERFFSPNALRPDLYLLLVINLCFDDKNMFVNIQPTYDTTLCLVEHTPCECTFTS